MWQNTVPGWLCPAPLSGEFSAAERQTLYTTLAYLLQLLRESAPRPLPGLFLGTPASDFRPVADIGFLEG